VFAPRVNDRRTDPDTGERRRFASAILPGDYFKALPTFTQRLDIAGCRAAGTLVQVCSLALPELLVEIETVAAA
jgi:hypothetical protein